MLRRRMESYFVRLTVGSLLACTAPEAPRDGNDERVSVRTARVEIESWQERVMLTGTLRSRQTIELRAQAPGTVTRIGYGAGQHVPAGQVLFVVAGERQQRQVQAQAAALRNARSELEQAERTLQRHEDLYERQAVALAELEQADTRVKQLQATVDRLEAELSVTRADQTLRAPVAGRVSESLVEEGSYVTAAEVLATLYSNELEVVTAAPERLVGQVHVGQAVSVRTRAHPDHPLHGEVTYVSPAVDPRSRELTIRAALEPTDLEIAPGAFGQVQLALGAPRRAPSVPEQALVGTHAGYMLYLVHEDRVQRQMVEVGQRRAGHVEIRQGVEAGDEVVVEGQLRLTDGERVRRVPLTRRANDLPEAGP